MIYFVVAILSLFAAALEGISFAGYVLSHVGIRAYYIYIMSIFLALVPSRKAFPFSQILLKISIGIACFYTALIFLETIHYPNYVYTLLHINPVTFQFFVALLWFHTLSLSGTKFLRSLLISGLIFVGISGAGRTLGMVYENIVKISKDPFASYESKMASVYPGFYPAIQIVKSLTPDSATILIPPQGNPWEVEGNAAMVTYFLYPRKVVNLDPSTIADLPDNSYLLIAKGSWPRTGAVDYGWPKIGVSASRIWHIDLTQDQVIEYARDYDPLFDKWDWGLIEVKHD